MGMALCVHNEEGVFVKILKGFPRLSIIGNNRILKPMILTNNQ